MDLTSGKLFGAIGKPDAHGDGSAAQAEAATRVVSGWYSLQWRRCHDRTCEAVDEAAPAEAAAASG
jgi:hypothetical protein